MRDPITNKEKLNFWSNLFSSESPLWEPLFLLGIRPSVWDLISPFSANEISVFLCKTKTSDPGKDYFDLRPYALQLSILFNAILLTNILPERFLTASTTLILKKARPASPGDFRPILVSSVLSRTMFGVLAAQVTAQELINPTQRAFVALDGCVSNIILLNSLVYEAKKNLKPLCGVFLDVKKALDSVSH